MTIRTFVRALACLGLLAMPAIPAPAAAQSRVLGGFRDIATGDAGAQAAAEFAAGELGGSLQSVDTAQTQSAAGASYRLTITLEGGAVWQVVVYRNLQGEHSLTSSSQQSDGEVDTGTNDGSDTSGDDE